METSFNQQDVAAINKRFKKQVTRVTGIGSLLLVVYVATR